MVFNKGMRIPPSSSIATPRHLQDAASTLRGQACIERLNTLLQQPPTAISQGSHAAGWALLALLREDQTCAEKARNHIEDVRADKYVHSSKGAVQEPLWNSRYKMILRTDPAIGVALAAALAGHFWEKDYRTELAQVLLSKGTELITGGGQGWNESPASNWQANVCSAAAVCAVVSADLHPGKEADALLERSIQGVLAYFRTQVGETGWTQESLNYFRYPLDHHLLLFLMVMKHRGMLHLFEGLPPPWLLHVLFYSFVPGCPHAAMVHNRSACHQDHWRSGEYAMGACVLPQRYHAAFQSFWGALCGPEGDASLGIFLPHHALGALLTQPDLHGPESPDTCLPPWWMDAKKGCLLSRNRWKDSHDTVVCVDANQHPMNGTGTPGCAGSFTLLSQGVLWARGAVKTRENFNVIHCGGMQETAGGVVTHLDVAENGSFRIQLDLSEVYLQSWQRHFECLHGPDGTVRLEVVDEIPDGIPASHRAQHLFHGMGTTNRTASGWDTVQDGHCLKATFLEGAMETRLLPPYQEPDYPVEAPLYTACSSVAEGAVRVHLRLEVVPENVHATVNWQQLEQQMSFVTYTCEELEQQHRRQSAEWIQDLIREQHA